MGRKSPFTRRKTRKPRRPNCQNNWRGHTLGHCRRGFCRGPGFSHQNLLVNVLTKSSWRERGRREGAVAETLQEILPRFEGKTANSGGQDRAGGARAGPSVTGTSSRPRFLYRPTSSIGR